ncbi:hypothetical protein DPMN_140698 [Dreissena polymorpha]|uniref:Uncharacterized protein n=1 Tax=Dreissena polymorpha TaxID=45954 RepID=A0A9D4JLY9_DREPO|nr:hypothetical protein DPMN_140698 [Dreissena polymorpha]
MWSAYGDCSATCKGGNRTRTRDCTRPEPAWGGAECVGVKFEIGECNTNPCNGIRPLRILVTWQ